MGGAAVAARSRAFLARAMSAPSGRRGGAPLPGGAGAAGGDVTLHIVRDKSVRHLIVQTGDRLDYLQPWRLG